MTTKARPMLLGRTVTGYTAESSSPYATAPAGYSYAELTYSGDSPTRPVWQQVRDQYAGEASERCSPATTTTETTEPETAPEASSSDDDVHVDTHHHNLPDGALTGGFCRHKRWC